MIIRVKVNSTRGKYNEVKRDSRLDKQAEGAISEGVFLPCNSESDLDYLLHAILEKVGRDTSDAVHIISRASRYLSKKAKLQGICINEICGMWIIAIAIFDPEDNFDDMYEDFSKGINVDEHPYVFCWCENLDVPDFSEFGDIYLDRREDGTLYRVCS